ncbi:MAG TPA: amidohydrolase family protein [Bosea sp. (in: a-proteobacteria)]
MFVIVRVAGGLDPQPQRVLDMATRNGARTLDALGEIGSVEVGKKADITLLDLNQPAMRPIIRLTSNIVNYAHPGLVHSVIVDGEFVMRDRKVLTIDEPALLAEAQAVTEAVWRRMVAANADIAPPKGEIPFLDA